MRSSGSYQRFAHAAFAAYYADGFLHMAARVGRRGEIRFLAITAGTIFATIAAIVITVFAHLLAQFFIAHLF